ncbi:MAG TPA: c-type cytochrome, partial [Sinorhizobium sp.]|nr:c-type cytochrome [Sinorhizobium sp.]
HLMGSSPSAARADGRLRIEVTGEMWWWRVTYVDEAGRRIESANEIRLPVGRPVEVELTSADVIHSFWVPRLAGKLDMIPGRTNSLTLHVTKPGISRGQCAEYCGGPHALMSFHVIAMPEDQFAAWLDREAGNARLPAGADEAAGQALFLSSGCVACHSVRGTEARGTIGPDLTHVGARHSLAAAALENDAASFARWIRDGQHVKPENLMPPFEIFSEGELIQLASYLDQLR